ncbi:MAG: hypothetical protein ACLGI9_07235 [Thermoanaerobaculia bacterium]
MRRIFIALSLAASLAAAPPTLFDLFSSLWSESGSHLDPDGAPAPQNDEGSRLDPNGAPAPQADEGSHIDPDG